MDKKPLSERVREIDYLYTETEIGLIKSDTNPLADEILTLERRLEEYQQGNTYIGAVKYLNKRIAETTDGAKLYRELWLDVANQQNMAEHAWKKWKGHYMELKADNGLNRAEVEVERLLKVVAEQDEKIKLLQDCIVDSEAEYNAKCDELAEKEAEIERLKEYEYMYKDLCD